MQRILSSVLMTLLLFSELFGNSHQKPNESSSDEICIEKPKNKNYKISSKPETSWRRAWNHCDSQGMALVSIETINDELDLTESLVTLDSTSARFYWTSGRHLGESWFWVTNNTDAGLVIKPMYYKNWADSKSPEGSVGNSEDAFVIEIKDGKNYGWKPIYSRKIEGIYPICEKVIA